MSIVVTRSPSPPLWAQRSEVVERKGVGHPDTICDAIMDAASVALCARYVEACGRVLHHNLDKALLVAGGTSVRLGGGVVDAPMRLVFGDRATYEVGRERIDVGGIVQASAARWLREHLRYVDPDEHVVFQNEIKPGAPELVDLFARGELGANDTSVGVGYAPLTPCERLVLDLESHVQDPKFKRRFPEIGEDVKVLGARDGADLDLIVAAAFVDRHVPSEREYFARKEEVRAAIEGYAREAWGPNGAVAVSLNALDRPGRGIAGMYLTVLGTSAESGDSGQVGRGNRANGLTNASRPMSAEAVPGKNPVSHIGKIYNVLADEIAQRIHAEVDGVREAYVRLVSRIGAPVSQPAHTIIDIAVDDGAPIERAEAAARRIAADSLAQVDALVERLTRGAVRVW